MAGEANLVADWLKLVGVVVSDNGLLYPQRGVLKLIGFTVTDDPNNDQIIVQGSGGGGGGGGPTFDSAVISSSLKVSRVTSWGRFKIDTSGAARTITAWDAAVEGDQIDLLDVKRAFGTHSVTFAGNGHNVEDPQNQDAAPASVWTSPAGFIGLQAFSWVLVNDGTTTFWKAI